MDVYTRFTPQLADYQMEYTLSLGIITAKCFTLVDGVWTAHSEDTFDLNAIADGSTVPNAEAWNSILPVGPVRWAQVSSLGTRCDVVLLAPHGRNASQERKYPSTSWALTADGSILLPGTY